MHADILIKNGNCVTMEDKKTKDWIAIEKSRIVAMGNGAEYEPFIGNHTIVFDAKGKTVLPGFIDSHFHVVQTALNSVSLDLSEARTHQELGERIREAYKNLNGNYIRGIRIVAEQFREKKFPERTLLDKYCNDVPVWLNSLEYQVSMLNTYAMLYFKIPFTAEGVEMDEKQMPTGIFSKKANAILRSNILKNISDNDRREAISGIMANLLNHGITTVNAMEGGTMYSDKDANFIFEHGKDFPIDMELFYQTMDIEKIKAMGLKRVGGCLYIDGTMGARTAALSFEYADCPGTMGSLCLTQQEINDFVLKCYENNLQLALYTIGDRAIQVALNAHENALYQTGITGLRHRLEHVELATEAQIEKANELGILFSMQPTYELYWGGPGKMYEQRLGENYIRTNPFDKIIQNGVVICGGSDSDITEPRPLLGIHAAVNHPVESHRVSIYEALKMFTCNGAYGIFQENDRGTLGVGKLADIVILDDDIFSVPTDQIDKIKVCVTIKSGEILFNNLG
ncbi:amidohydrolase [Anaerovorax sp. IOR16]|uniref:amidohydrolase n=1 Tax=Anaerovorax sp. IOR16 TaxID=2773458 RepID=UPI0019D24E4C|nr:amidohydrolase [Anaerovorax sp. IOR16]